MAKCFYVVKFRLIKLLEALTVTLFITGSLFVAGMGIKLIIHFIKETWKIIRQ